MSSAAPAVEPGASWLAATARLTGPVLRRLLAEGDAGLVLRGALCAELGTRPARGRLAAVLELARAELSAQLRPSSGIASIPRQQRIIAAHDALTRLSAQAPTYNFDPGLLGMEIGGLLAGVAGSGSDA